MTDQNMDMQIDQESLGPAQAGGAKRSWDPSFVRNMKVVGAVAVGALTLMVGLFVMATSAGKPKQEQASATIPLGSTPGSVTPGEASELSPAEIERLRRVQVGESAEAAKRGETYIPKEIPITPAHHQGGKSAGPGVGYQMMSGEPYLGGQQYPGQQNAAAAMDPQRAGDIRRGIETQLAAIVARHEPPEVSSASAYQSPQQQSGQAGSRGSQSAAIATSSSAAAASAATTAGPVIVPALRIAGVRLVSPIDTERGEFVSAVVDAGPLTGAYLTGTAKLVPSETGVNVIFNRMTWRDQDYKINAMALDPATSGDPVGAEVDRKLMQRFLLPVVFETAQAYATAMARPAQTVVVNAAGTTVASPAAVAKEAAAAGVAAGLRRASQASTRVTATAYMPANTALPILFLEAVTEPVKK